MKKPTRVAAIIETTEGILLVQDAKDKFRDETLRDIDRRRDAALQDKRIKLAKRMEFARMIVQDGRFSLPGGKIEPCDYEEANATSIMNIGKPETPEQIALYRDVVRECIIREIDEELGLGVDNKETIKHIAEIQGRFRDHIICLVRAEGLIKINKTELTGIGLLTQRPSIPLNEMFYQHHVREVYHRYVKGDESRPNYALRYLSKINVRLDLIADWFRDITAGHSYTSLKPKNEHMPVAPALPHSSPNFMIYDEKGQVVNELKPFSLTNTNNAKIVPPDPQRQRELVKKKSDPAMKAVKIPDINNAPIVEIFRERGDIPANTDADPNNIPISESRPTSSTDEVPTPTRHSKKATR